MSKEKDGTSADDQSVEEVCADCPIVLTGDCRVKNTCSPYLQAREREAAAARKLALFRMHCEAP